jgi:hypothetical protein
LLYATQSTAAQGNVLPHPVFLIKPIQPACFAAGTALMPFSLSAALSSTFTGWRLIAPLPSATAAFFAAATIGFVNRCPRAPLSFLLADTALSITAFDLRRFPFLFSRIFLFAPSCHIAFLFIQRVNAPPQPNGFIL